MSKYCSDCNHLDINSAKSDGIYACKIRKKQNPSKCFANANDSACENFETCYGRNSNEKQRLYDLGKEAKNSNDISIGPYIFLVIALGIVWLIATIAGY